MNARDRVLLEKARAKLAKLGGLRIGEVSSVDRAANPHARVMLHKREDTKMATLDELLMSNSRENITKASKVMEKYDLETIRKVGEKKLDELTEQQMHRNPGINWQKARNLALASPEYVPHIRAEKLRILREDYPG